MLVLGIILAVALVGGVIFLTIRSNKKATTQAQFSIDPKSLPKGTIEKT